MATRKRVKRVRRIVDLLVVDPEDRPILLVEVKEKGCDHDQTLSQLVKYLGATDPAAPFGMIVDPDRIHIYRWDGSQLSGPVFSSVTASVFRYYSDYFDKFEAAGMEERYLLILVKAWLRDLAYRWKSKSSDPPGSKELGELGLLPLLKGATIDSEVSFRGHGLYRD